LIPLPEWMLREGAAGCGSAHKASFLAVKKHRRRHRLLAFCVSPK